MLIAIAIITVTSVTAPVRRLIEATRRLAERCSAHARVSRAGVRELDALAVAFNKMAEQLQHAQSAVRAYQIELESKVDERTRELNHLAYHDPLTDLPNRRQLFVHLEASIERAKSNGVARSRCCSSTSTTSRRSTTASATRSAIACCRRSASACA